MSLNKVMLIGHLGTDVELKRFDGGNCIGNFSLATNETYKNKEGEKVTNTHWHNIVIRNKTAEVLHKYCKKGDKLFVEGSIKTRSWEAQTEGMTEKKYITEVHLQNFEFLNNKPTEDAGPAEKYSADKAPPLLDSEDDDLPF